MRTETMITKLVIYGVNQVINHRPDCLSIRNQGTTCDETWVQYFTSKLNKLIWSGEEQKSHIH